MSRTNFDSNSEISSEPLHPSLSEPLHPSLPSSNRYILDIFLLCLNFLICFQILLFCFPFHGSAILEKMLFKKRRTYLFFVSFIFTLSILPLFLHVIREGLIDDRQQREKGYLKAHDFLFQLGQYCGLQGFCFLGRSRNILSRQLLWVLGFVSLSLWLCFSFFATLVQPFEFPFREQDLGRLDLIWIIYFHVLFMILGFMFIGLALRIFSVSFTVFLLVPSCLSLLFQVIPFTTLPVLLCKTIASLLNSISFLTLCVVLIFKVDEEIGSGIESIESESESLQMPHRIVVRWVKSRRSLQDNSKSLADNSKSLEESWRPSDWYSSEATRVREWTSQHISSINLNRCL